MDEEGEDKMIKYTIFCERVWDDETFNELKEFILKKGVRNCNLYCLTPANFYLSVSEQGYQGTKEEFSGLLAERYKFLQSMGCKINLHLHLSLRPEKMDQEPLFREACEWMHANKFECRDIAYGWYLSSKESRTLEEEYGLKWIKGKGQYNIHDYEIHGGIFGLMMILQNLRNFLR